MCAYQTHPNDQHAQAGGEVRVLGYASLTNQTVVSWYGQRRITSQSWN
jgi:hypothetical protein